MSSGVEFIAVSVALAFMLFVVRLVGRQQLKEKYAFLWIGVGGIVVALSLMSEVTDRLARAVGVNYGPAIIFLLAILFLLAVVAHLSWEISRLEERTRRLAEEIALHRAETEGNDAGAFDSRSIVRRS